MSRLMLSAALLLSTAAGLRAQQAGQLGAGVAVGSLPGPTLGYWFDRSFSADVGIGFIGDAAFYGHALFHGWDLLPRPQKGKLGGYAGFGPKIETGARSPFALKTVLGVEYWIEGRPIQVFLEAGPSFRLSPSQRMDSDGGIGVRFYFSGR